MRRKYSTLWLVPNLNSTVPKAALDLNFLYTTGPYALLKEGQSLTATFLHTGPFFITLRNADGMCPYSVSKYSICESGFYKEPIHLCIKATIQRCVYTATQVVENPHLRIQCIQNKAGSFWNQRREPQWRNLLWFVESCSQFILSNCYLCLWHVDLEY